jgi:hypothetical protein
MQKHHDFSVDATAWQPFASGQAELKLSSESLRRIAALRLDFDFKGGRGFAVARQALNCPMPEDYALRFRVRGHGAVNDLELKLVDTTGQNVWRHVLKGLKLSEHWTKKKIDSQEMEFAWGPAGGGVIKELGAIEIGIVAGEGGTGTMWIADLVIEDCTPTATPVLEASSEQPGFSAAEALGSGWKPRADDQNPWIVVDSVEPRRIGGLIIDWLDAAPPSGFQVRGSLNGQRWKTLHKALHAGGTRSYVYLPDTKLRFLRLELSEPSSGAKLSPQSFEFARSIDAFWHNIAQREPRGWHPRWLHREQSYWTPIGRSNGTQCALMNEEGMVEVAQGSFSIEPMLWINNRLVTWTDVSLRQDLHDGWLPMPSSIWEAEQWRLRVQAEATDSGLVRVRYRLENLTDEPRSARLYVLARPFQVTPPWQRYGAIGGVSAIHDLEWRDGAVRVNEKMLLVPTTRPTAFAATSFDDGFIASYLATGGLPADTQTHDAFGFASGALAFDLALDAHDSQECSVVSMSVDAPDSISEPAFDWGARIPLAQWAANAWGADAIRTSLTATAHVLVTRDGPALQPGPRRYTRSWIRDGTIMSAALLRMGRVDEVREFIRWYAPYQRADGFVPCCVDHSGPDWLVEHDSHGQLIALIADYYRFTADDRVLKESWDHIVRAVGYLEGLIESDGILPISVSHEGYLAQPVHSYWDDFWALRGLRDAVDLARIVGAQDLGARWQALAARFTVNVFSSVESTRKERHLDFIPGSIEWADFDPTSTANAIALLGLLDEFDRGAVERTFDRYLYDWRRKRSGALEAPNYTPYEIRIIGAFVRLGRRDAALELLKFFLSDRRALAWNQWPEISWRDARAPAHLGDLPHTWVAAEYVLALRSLLAYELNTDQVMVLAAGLAPEWIMGAGVVVKSMPTLYGKLSYSVRRLDPQTVRFEIGSGNKASLILRPPLTAPLVSVTVDGRASASFDRDSVTIEPGAAEVICSTDVDR